MSLISFSFLGLLLFLSSGEILLDSFFKRKLLLFVVFTFSSLIFLFSLSFKVKSSKLLSISFIENSFILNFSEIIPFGNTKEFLFEALVDIF